MCSKDPESVVFSPERLDGGALREIPHTHCLVFTTRNDEFVFRMEERIGDVVEMSPASINLPSLCFAHPPDLDCTIISRGDDQREGRMEGGKIDASVMTFEDILYGRKRVKRFKVVRSGAGSTLSQAGYVPNAYGLIHGC